MKINVLEPKVYNRISAGEVVERPASIVKELVENSIDAGAENIRIEIEDGGIKSITVSDDGCGIDRDDITTAFLPHATSKIKAVEDLDSIESLGFRGEALASISSVCQVKLSTKTKDSVVGYSIKVNGGIFDEVKEIAKENGTTISCSNLFFNTPVRAKFLRKPKTEEGEVTHLVERFMLSNSNIAFTYYVDGKLIYNTKSCSMQDIIYTIYGREVYENLVEVNFEDRGYKIFGYVTKPKISKSNRTYQNLFINGRCVENFLISNAVQSVFEAFLMRGRFPVYVLSITLPPNCVDVNVHPSKKEVKFENPNMIFSMVRQAVENALLSTNQIANFSVDDYNNSYQDASNPFKNNRSGSSNETVSVVTRYETNSDGNSENVQDERLTSENSQSERLIRENGHEVLASDSIKPVGSLRDRMTQGKSFNVDFFNNEEKLYEPKEVEIDVDSSSDQDATNKAIDELSKKSLKDKYDNSSNGPTFYFDQSGEKFTGEIAKATEEKFISASVKDEMKILGTLFKTYIVIELADSVYFIDQHAAHERLLYDKLVSQVDNKEVASQDLLAPFTFTVGAKEAEQIDLALPQLEAMGFVIEKDNYTYIIKSLPYVLSYINLEGFVDELVKESANWERKPSDYIHSKLCQSACKHAIKAGDSLTKDECTYLIEQIRKGVMLCPHGRPITLVITRYEFEKMFKRVV